MTFPRVVAESGLSKVELAKCYGVSRQMIHYWRTVGLSRPGTYTARMAEVITAALIAAIERRVLPLWAMNPVARKARIASMAKTLQSLKPAPLK